MKKIHKRESVLLVNITSYIVCHMALIYNYSKQKIASEHLFTAFPRETGFVLWISSISEITMQFQQLCSSCWNVLNEDNLGEIYLPENWKMPTYF